MSPSTDFELPHGVCYELCECAECKSKSLIERFLKARKLLEDLTKPEKMAAREDPLTDAFKLSKEIKKLRGMHLKKELRGFAKNCKTFTAGLCDECGDENEIAALYNFDVEDLKELTPEKRAKVVETLHEAIRAHHIEFVAHRNSQLILDTVVYSTIPMIFKKQNLLKTLLFYTFYTLLFPIWVVIFLVRPKSKISVWMKTPFVKFVGHVSQFVVFLGLLVLSALRDSHEPSVIEYLIFIFVLAMTCQEIWGMSSRKPRIEYFFTWWNCITTAMLSIYLLAGAFWLMGFITTGAEWSATFGKTTDFRERAAHTMLLLGNSCYSIASVLSVCHLGDLCQVNSVFGPLQLSVYRMFKDIAKFLSIFLGLFFAFTLGVRNLYSYNRSLQLKIRREENKTDSNIVITNQRLDTFWDAVQTMFWTLFDQTDLENFNTTGERFEITQETGKFLFATFCILAMMVGFNMLIAMMNNSYELIAEDKYDLHWKFSRTHMWLGKFVGKTDYCLPPPYNIIQIFFVVQHFSSKKDWDVEKTLEKNVEEESIEMVQNGQLEQEEKEKKEKEKKEKEEKEKEEKEQKRKEIVRKIVVRYLRKLESKESDNDIPSSRLSNTNSTVHVSNV